MVANLTKYFKLKHGKAFFLYQASPINPTGKLVSGKAADNFGTHVFDIKISRIEYNYLNMSHK
jgi:hypothetical protein